MGMKFGYLDELGTRRPNVQGANNFAAQRAKGQEEETPSVAPVEPVQAVTPVEKPQKPKKASAPAKEKPKASKKGYSKEDDFKDCKNLSLYVSIDFKTAIKLYCIEHHTSERDLIVSVTDSLKDEITVDELISMKYDIDNKGHDRAARINAPVREKAMKYLIKACMQCRATKAYLVAQAVAHKIGYKKELAY